MNASDLHTVSVPRLRKTPQAWLKKYPVVLRLVLLVQLLLTSCTGLQPSPAILPTPPLDPPATAVKPASQPAAQSYSEAPVLAEQVQAGSLPPLAERLPEQPFVVGPGVYLVEAELPDWQPGVYGGVLRSAHGIANWAPDIFSALNEPFLHAPKISDQNIVCNVCQSFTVSGDNRVFTFSLRKGLKWSDGAPVTTEDVRFTWEDIQNNPSLYPSGPDQLWRAANLPSGTPAKVEILDETTFQVSFDAPYGGFLRNLAIVDWAGYDSVLNPAHYLKKFHLKYTSLEQMQPELERLNLTGGEWWQVFTSHWCRNTNMTEARCVGQPGLYPWLPVASGDPNLLAWERNPYYFKVDTRGQQLPYIDRLTSIQMENVEMSNLLALTGEVDFLRENASLARLAEYQQVQEKAGFQIVLLRSHLEPICLALIQTYADPNWRKLVSDIRFRQAISLAINRQEIIDSLFYGYAALPLNTVGEQYSRYDVAQANRLLDDMGLTQKNAEGYRLNADGSVVEFLFEHGLSYVVFAPASELLAAYLKEIGVKLNVKQIDHNLLVSRILTNQVPMTLISSRGAGLMLQISPSWDQWINSQGARGEEPPQWIKDLTTLQAKKWAILPNSAAYQELVAAEYRWVRDNLPFINFVEDAKQPLLVNRRLGNVPSSASTAYAIAVNFSVVQMYYLP